MIGFLEIDRFEFERNCVKEAYSFLRQAGNKSYEAVALFAGIVIENRAIINKVICPLQESSRSKYGLMYSVAGDELHKINLWLYENKMKLFAQIHSHPNEAYHSETDDEFPIISTVGGISIVVPYFAQDPLNYHDWAYYRLSSDSAWKELSNNEIINLIKIV